MKFSNNNTFDLPVVNVCQELGDRREQQDRFVVNQHELGLLVAIADGHGGDKVANIVASQLTFIFNTQLDAALKKSKKITQSLLTGRFLRAVLKKTVQQLVNVCQHQQSGSTLSIALIEQGYQHCEHYQRGRRVTTAQLGDSIIAMSRKKGTYLCQGCIVIRYLALISQK